MGDLVLWDMEKSESPDALLCILLHCQVLQPHCLESKGSRDQVQGHLRLLKVPQSMGYDHIPLQVLRELPEEWLSHFLPCLRSCGSPVKLPLTEKAFLVCWIHPAFPHFCNATAAEIVFRVQKLESCLFHLK